MVAMSITDIVDRLVGPVIPVGDTTIDNDRYKNLETLEELAKHVMNQLAAVADLRGNHMYSINNAGKYADIVLSNILEEYSEYAGNR